MIAVLGLVGFFIMWIAGPFAILGLMSSVIRENFAASVVILVVAVSLAICTVLTSVMTVWQVYKCSSPNELNDMRSGYAVGFGCGWSAVWLLAVIVAGLAFAC